MMEKNPDILQVILNEIKESNKQVNVKLDMMDHRLERLEQRLDGLEQKLEKVEKTVGSNNDILNSFKIDIDFLAGKQTKTEMKVNRIEKMLES